MNTDTTRRISPIITILLLLTTLVILWLFVSQNKQNKKLEAQLKASQEQIAQVQKQRQEQEQKGIARIPQNPNAHDTKKQFQFQGYWLPKNDLPSLLLADLYRRSKTDPALNRLVHDSGFMVQDVDGKVLDWPDLKELPK